VIRNRPLQRALGPLALMAALLLATLPTFGRVATGGAGQVRLSLCTSAGLQLVSLPVADPHAPAPHPAHDECPYCPLLGTTLAPPALSFAPIRHEPAGPLPAIDAVRPGARQPDGLGARGPPALA
jgi:hypothetical protein